MLPSMPLENFEEQAEVITSGYAAGAFSIDEACEQLNEAIEILEDVYGLPERVPLEVREAMFGRFVHIRLDALRRGDMGATELMLAVNDRAERFFHEKPVINSKVAPVQAEILMMEMYDTETPAPPPGPGPAFE